MTIRAAHIPQTTAGGDCIEGYPDGFTSGGRITRFDRPAQGWQRPAQTLLPIAKFRNTK